MRGSPFGHKIWFESPSLCLTRIGMQRKQERAPPAAPMLHKVLGLTATRRVYVAPLCGTLPNGSSTLVVSHSCLDGPKSSLPATLPTALIRVTA